MRSGKWDAVAATHRERPDIFGARVYVPGVGEKLLADCSEEERAVAAEAKARAEGEAMIARADKTRETRLRRMAERQGLLVRKSRRRDERALDYGTYVLVDPWTNALVVDPTGYGLTIDELEDELMEGRR